MLLVYIIVAYYQLGGVGVVADDVLVEIYEWGGRVRAGADARFDLFEQNNQTPPAHDSWLLVE